MPIYEYSCHDCGRRVSLLWRTFADAEGRQAVCPRCGGTHLKRLISRVAVVRSDDSRLDDLTDTGDMAGLAGDPVLWLASCARWPVKRASSAPSSTRWWVG
jgi:putative FmdB family regulatory protein